MYAANVMGKDIDKFAIGAVGKQWTFNLTSLSRFSGFMSQ
jgi:hypothetical protein